MAQQDVRFYLNGLLLEVSNGELRAVATDGHRLAYCQQPSSIEIEENQQIIVPRKGIMELQKLLEDSEQTVDIEIGPNHLRMSAADLRFTSKLIDGRFPDYQRVIPQPPFSGDASTTVARKGGGVHVGVYRVNAHRP